MTRRPSSNASRAPLRSPLGRRHALSRHPLTRLRPRKRTNVARIAAAFGKTQLELAGHSVFLALSGMIDEVAGELIRKDFHTAHLAGTKDSFLTRLSYFLFDANFILAAFSHSHLPDIADHRKLAKVTYLHALTGREFTLDEIDRFKLLLVECKFPP